MSAILRDLMFSAGAGISQFGSDASGIVVYNSSAAIGVAGSILVQDVSGDFLTDSAGLGAYYFYQWCNRNWH